MDQGVISNLKQKYNKRMLNMARIKAKSGTKYRTLLETSKYLMPYYMPKLRGNPSIQKQSKNVLNIVVYKRIMHVHPSPVKKCFRCSGVQESYACSPPTTPVDDASDEDPEFAQFFQDLLDVPLDEYLAMDAELEQENPSRAPDAQSYNNNDTCLQEFQQDEPTIITHDDALDQLYCIQKSNLEDIRLFELLEQAMNHSQNKKMTTEITNKSKQSSIAKYFKF